MASRAATGRAIAVIVGLVLALVAAFLLWQYVSAADQRAQEGAELVDVFIADGAIPEGTLFTDALERQLIQPSQVPAATRPGGALASLDSLRGLAASVTILQGQAMQQAQWGEPRAVGGDFTVESGQVAIAVEVGVPEGVGNFLEPGNRVGVIAHINAQVAPVTIGPDGQPMQSTEQPEVDQTSAKYLVEGEILAIGQRVAATDAQGAGAGQVDQSGQVLATLSVTPEAAEKLVFANNEGVMHFTLLADGEQLPTGTPGSTFDTLFDQ